MSTRFSRRTFLAAACGVEGLAGRGQPGQVPLLLDLGPACILRESLEGFRSALTKEPSVRSAGLIIPGTGILDQWHHSLIHDHLRRGGCVLLESAQGLGCRPGDSPYFPYVDFTWPVRARIREFCPLPLRAVAGDRVIATHLSRPVALRRGMLVLLGSPIGPALLDEDADARRWLMSVLRWIQTHSEAQYVPPCREIRRK